MNDNFEIMKVPMNGTLPGRERLEGGGGLGGGINQSTGKSYHIIRK